MADVGDNSKAGLVSALNGALADTVALYFKTKNFHWHVAGPRFRDLHVLFDEQAAQLVGTVDDLGERVRKNDEYTLTSIGSVAKATRIKDQDDVSLTADDPTLAGWVGIAAPLALLAPQEMSAGADTRPTKLLVPENDQFRSVAEAREICTNWKKTSIEAISGADHFFSTGTKTLSERVTDFVVTFFQ